MSSRAVLIFAAFSGFLYVALGAFGAHVLKSSLGIKELDWLATGLQYQGFHTLVLLAIGIAMQYKTNIWWYWSGAFLSIGTVLFSGSLYCLALSHLMFWAYLTPVGGVCFLIGWALMAMGVLRRNKRANCHE